MMNQNILYTPQGVGIPSGGTVGRKEETNECIILHTTGSGQGRQIEIHINETTMLVHHYKRFIGNEYWLTGIQYSNNPEIRVGSCQEHEKIIDNLALRNTEVNFCEAQLYSTGFITKALTALVVCPLTNSKIIRRKHIYWVGHDHIYGVTRIGYKANPGLPKQISETNESALERRIRELEAELAAKRETTIIENKIIMPVIEETITEIEQPPTIL